MPYQIANSKGSVIIPMRIPRWGQRHLTPPRLPRVFMTDHLPFGGWPFFVIRKLPGALFCTIIAARTGTINRCREKAIHTTGASDPNYRTRRISSASAVSPMAAGRKLIRNWFCPSLYQRITQWSGNLGVSSSPRTSANQQEYRIPIKELSVGIIPGRRDAFVAGITIVQISV